MAMALKHGQVIFQRALKVMSPELTNQPGFKDYFIREGQFVALKHPI